MTHREGNKIVMRSVSWQGTPHCWLRTHIPQWVYRWLSPSNISVHTNRWLSPKLHDTLADHLMAYHCAAAQWLEIEPWGAKRKRAMNGFFKRQLKWKEACFFSVVKIVLKPLWPYKIGPQSDFELCIFEAGWYVPIFVRALSQKNAPDWFGCLLNRHL